MRLLAIAALFAAQVPGVAQSYAPNSTTTYDLRVLTERPGVVYVSPKYLTVIEFGDLIDEIGTSQPGLLQVKVSDSEHIIFLKALKQAGSADLVVRVGGYVALFRVVVDPKMDAPRRYVVTFTSTTARPTAAPQGDAQPSPGEEARDLRGQDAKAEPKAEASPKAPVEYRFQPMRSGNGWIIYYEVTNRSSQDLTFRMKDLTVTRGAVSVPYRLVRTTFGPDVEVLEAGGQASGMIVVENSPEGVSWQWVLRSGATTYTLQGTAP